MLVVLLLQAACATVPFQGRRPSSRALADETAARVYTVDLLESEAAPHPVPMARADFQRAFARLSRDVRLGQKTPRQAAHELLRAVEGPSDALFLEAAGDWSLESSGGRGFTLVPEHQRGPVVLTPRAEATLQETYLRWCAHQGGGDCLGLLDDGAMLRADDRRTLAVALALGTVLDETREALGRELLNERALVSMVVWTVALYGALWVVPEPTTKAVAATLTVVLLGYLGLSTVYGLVDGWARLAEGALVATTFEELRAAGETFGKVLGEDAARVLILAVATVSGQALGQLSARMISLPGFHLAQAQWAAQGGAAVLGRVEVAVATEGALVRAVAAVEAVALSARGPLAVVMLKKGAGGGAALAPGGRCATTVLNHRGGNRQVELSDGQRWHLPSDKSVADIPAEDSVGTQLQDAVTQAASEWGPDKISVAEKLAMGEARRKGRHWLAHLLEREARGRYVQTKVKERLEHLYDFSLSRGVDVVDPATGTQYEILSGSVSNLARHGRRMPSEFFRMLTF